MAPTPNGGIHPPIKVILSWPSPNYEHPVERHGATAVTVILTIVTIVIVAIRIFVRWVMQNVMEIDDWLVIAAMVPTFALAVGVCLAVNVFHFNVHVWDIEIGNFVSQRKLVYANELLYLVATGLIKISILFYCARIKGATRYPGRYLPVVYTSIGFVVLYMTQCIFLLIFNCTPVSDYWNQLQPSRIFSEHKPKCVGEGSSLIAETGISLSQDFLTAVVATYIYAVISIEKRKKIGLAALCTIAFTTCAIGCLRLYYIYYIFYKTYDVAWYTYNIWILTMLEVLLGACCASVPPIKVFLSRCAHRRPGSSWWKIDFYGYNGAHQSDDSFQYYPEETEPSSHGSRPSGHDIGRAGTSDTAVESIELQEIRKPEPIFTDELDVVDSWMATGYPPPAHEPPEFPLPPISRPAPVQHPQAGSARRRKEMLELAAAKLRAHDVKTP